MPFDTIIGHARPKRVLQSALRSERLAHAFLFHGEDRIGKLLTARVLAQAVNCEASPPPDPPDACGACRSCRQIESGAHPDVTILTATGAKGETDYTREIESRFIYRPLIGRLKVVILDNADLLRREAANALLKTIEEPPPDSLIVLVSSRPEALLPTIRSRCQEIRFAPLALDVVEAAVRQQRGLSDHDARFLAVLSGGRLGLALEAETETLRAERAAFLRLVSPESVESVGGLLSVCEAIGKSDQAEAALTWLTAWFRDLLIVKAGGDRSRLVNADCVARLDALAARLTIDTILALAAYVATMHRGLTRNLNKQMMLEGLLLRLQSALQTKAA